MMKVEELFKSTLRGQKTVTNKGRLKSFIGRGKGDVADYIKLKRSCISN